MFSVTPSWQGITRKENKPDYLIKKNGNLNEIPHFST